MVLRKYSGKKTFNAFTVASKKTNNIFLGEELLDKLNNEQIIFTLSHEIAHKKNMVTNYLITIFSLLAYFFFCYIVANLLVFLKIANTYTTIVSIIMLMIGIITLFNLISWRDEFNADKIAVKHTKDIKSAVSTLELFDEKTGKKDYGIFNLILLDHPTNTKRIKKLKKISFI